MIFTCHVVSCHTDDKKQLTPCGQTVSELEILYERSQVIHNKFSKMFIFPNIQKSLMRPALDSILNKISEWINNYQLWATHVSMLAMPYFLTIIWAERWALIVYDSYIFFDQIFLFFVCRNYCLYCSYIETALSSSGLSHIIGGGVFKETSQ